MANDVISITKSLDRIADALEGQSGGSSGGESEPLMINLEAVYGEQSDYISGERMTVLASAIYDAFKSGRTCIVNLKRTNIAESDHQDPEGYGYVVHCTHERELEDSKLQISFQKYGNGPVTFYENDEGYPFYSYD